MSQRDDQVSLRHALDAARNIVASSQGWKRDDLAPDDLQTLGIIRLLEVIGEAANAVSAQFKAAHPEVPWRQMVGLRNRLIHAYFDVNLDIVWDTMQGDIPALIRVLEPLVERPH
ncbi:MAG: DUF86 domain-containing protein [Planctomycetota bacterium]|nr:MAG: DUF86 domain-containing protein [Planctomycetota bacterium]